LRGRQPVGRNRQGWVINDYTVMNVSVLADEIYDFLSLFQLNEFALSVNIPEIKIGDLLPADEQITTQ
jgi:hypothetical protein